MSSYISWTKNPTPTSLGVRLGPFCHWLLYEAPKQTLNAVEQLILTTDCDQLVPERENEDLLNLKEEGRHGPVVEKAGGRKGLL